MLKRIFKDCVTHFKNNPFFRKTVELYVITGAVIFFLFGIVSILAVSKATISQINATEQKMLEQACNTSDFEFRNIHSLATNKFEEDSAIHAAMSNPYSAVVSQNIQKTFSDIMASSDLIDSVYVVNLKNDIIYSTQTSAKSVSEFFDADILKYLAEHEAKSDIFFSRKAALDIYPHTTEDVQYITSVYRNSPDSALIVNISQKQFQSMVNLASVRDSYEMVILNSAGIVISHSNPEYFAENLSENPLFKKILNANKPSGTLKHGGTVANFVRSNTLGYSYISISAGGTSLKNFKNLLICMILFTILLLCVFVVCSALASLSTYSVYNNLKKNIYNMFNKSETDQPTSDEIESISLLLNEAKARYSSMETIQHQYTSTKQDMVLKKLLVGTFAYLQDDMESCNIKFPHQGFAVVVIKADHISKMDSDTIYMIKYAITNMGLEIFEKHAKAYAADINEYDVAFVLNFMSDGFIAEDIQKLNTYMQNFFQATVSASYDCTVTDSLEDISVLYHNAKHAALYKLINGHSSITKYADIVKFDSALSTYPEDIEHDIIKSITVQNEEDLNRHIRRFIGSLCNMSSHIILVYTDRLLLAIDQFSLKTNMAEETDISSNIQKIISEFETIDEIETYILNKCQNLMLKFSNTKFDSKKDVMVKNVLNYIEENYTDPNLSIDMIATQINRSANYTRSMFKQSQGISISDYITKKRFDEVCRLLVETNYTAQEIGKLLGLNSGSYFYTSFKKHTGYTPDQYRKIHRSLNTDGAATLEQ